MDTEEDIWAEDYIDEEVEALVAPDVRRPQPSDIDPDSPAALYGALEDFTRPAKRVRYRDPPKGNTKRGDAATKRTATVALAQAKGRTEPDQWREELAAGDRGKAIGTLSNTSLTHDSGHGFGPADQPRYE